MKTPALAALLLSACTTTLTVPVHTLSRATFAPSERSAVWDRAVEALQGEGSLIAYSDPVGGILRTEVQRADVRCSGSATWQSGPASCDATEVEQVTISTTGAATYSVHRAVSGVVRFGSALVTPADEAAFQSAGDSWISAVAGRAPTAAR